MIPQYNIPAGYAWHAFVKLSMAVPGSSDYTDITDPDQIPGGSWAICWVGSDNVPAIVTPIDWSQMTAEGYVAIGLTAEQTLEHSGERFHLEIRNDDTTSDLVELPQQTFFFVPNEMYNIQNDQDNADEL